MRKVYLLPLLLLPVLSCNQTSDDSRTGNSTTYIPNERKSETFFDTKRKALMDRVNLAAENAGKKLVILLVEKEKAESNVKAGLEKDIAELRNRKERLEAILIELRKASGKALDRYEEEIEHIIRDQRLIR